MSPIQIVDYQPQHQPWFEKFNRQWIEEYFVMEAFDEYVVTHPEEAILEKGGAILMALYENEVAGTVGLRRISPTVFEFTKMAVDPQFRRKGIAEAISYASFIKASRLGAQQIILYSNTKNAAAIQLYEKIGFTHLQPETGVYARANVKMEISIEDAMAVAKKENRFTTTAFLSPQ